MQAQERNEREEEMAKLGNEQPETSFEEGQPTPSNALGLESLTNEQLVQLVEGLAEGADTWGNDDAVQYFSALSQGVISAMSNPETQQYARQAVQEALSGKLTVEYWEEQLSQALGTLDTAKAAAAILRDVLQAASMDKDTLLPAVKQDWQAFQMNIWNANDDGVLTFSEISHCFLTLTLDLCESIYHDGPDTKRQLLHYIYDYYGVEQETKKGELDGAKLATLLVQRVLSSWMQDPLLKEKQSSASEEFLGTLMAVLMGPEQWRALAEGLDYLAPVVGSVLTAGVSAGAGIHMIAQYFAKGVQLAEQDSRGIAAVGGANTISVIDGQVWAIINFGPLQLAMNLTPDKIKTNEIYSLVRYQYTRVASAPVKQAVASSVDVVGALIKLIIGQVGETISVNRLIDSLYANESRVMNSAREFLREKLPGLADEAINAITLAMVKYLLAILAQRLSANKAKKRKGDDIKSASVSETKPDKYSRGIAPPITLPAAEVYMASPSLIAPDEGFTPQEVGVAHKRRDPSFIEEWFEGSRPLFGDYDPTD